MPRRRRRMPVPFPRPHRRRGAGWGRGGNPANGAWIVTLLVAAAFLWAYANRDLSAPGPVGQSNDEPSSIVASERSASASSPHLTLGNPSQARPDPAYRDNYLILRPQYALSYNDTRGTANWASWRLRVADLGDAPRLRTFLTDDELPASFYRVTHQDYTNSGFDRGHLVPHSDRDATPDDAASTYRMTNIIPQAPNVNQRSWATLETYARQLVQNGSNTLFIVAGPHGQGGVGSRGAASHIVRGRVTVPAECWKVIVVVPTALADSPERFTSATRVIAVRVANDDSLTTLEWAPFRTTPRDIEAVTGFRFFDRLRPDVAEALRDQLDRTRIPTPATPGYLR